ncbi:MAG: COG4315 family predicted lipoprotein [Rhodospirillaceae bacterium]
MFTNANDLQFNDANGMGVDKRWQVAAYGRYYLPENVTIHKTHKLGNVLATADGRTLYRRNSYIYQSGGGHGMRRGDTVRPAVGRDLGINPRCTIECDKWKPYIAPKGAQPSGDFSLVSWPDGRQQWTSRGYALWTYDGDTKPGDINGNDAYELKQPADAETVLDIGTPYDGAWALFWIAAFP